MTLPDRIAMLERRVHRLHAILATGLALLLVLPLLAFVTHDDEVRASRFVVVDDHGDVRGTWEARDGGDPRFEMRNAEGKSQIELSITRSSALAVLRDEKEQNRVGLAVEGHPHLLMHDGGQKPRVHLTVGKSGGPTLLFIHEDGTFPGGLGVRGDGTAWIKPDAWMAALEER